MLAARGDFLINPFGISKGLHRRIANPPQVENLPHIAAGRKRNNMVGLSGATGGSAPQVVVQENLVDGFRVGLHYHLDALVRFVAEHLIRLRRIFKAHAMRDDVARIDLAVLDAL